MRRLTAVLVTGLGLWSSPLAAQEDTARFQLEQFEPGEPSTAILNVARADVQGHLGWSAGIVTHYSAQPLVLVRGDAEDALVDGSLRSEVVGAVGATDWFDLALAVPVVFLQGDDLGVVGRPGESVTGGSLGDVRVAPRVVAPLDLPVGLALLGTVYLPTGDAASFQSDGTVRFEPKLAVDVDAGPVTVAANAGYQIRPERRLQNAVVDDAVRWSGGAEYRFLERFTVQGSVFGTAQLASDRDPGDGSEIAERSTSPIEAVGAVGVRLDPGVHVTLGGGTGLNADVGSPSWRVLAGVSWVAPGGEMAANGVGDGHDDSDREPDDRADGPGDRDGDGVADDRDRCPEMPGVVPTGCPDGDEDGDGLADAEDRCPGQPEDIDEFKDDDGCPDLDNDQDGVADEADRCPEAAEVPNGIDDEDGCPDAELLRMEGDQIKSTVEVIDPKTAAITPEGERALAQLADLVGGESGVAKIAIEVQVFESEEPEENEARSQSIAEAIKAQLIASGLEEHRAEARGLGDSRRVEGVSLDTRVNFMVLERRRYRRLEE